MVVVPCDLREVEFMLIEIGHTIPVHVSSLPRRNNNGRRVAAQAGTRQYLRRPQCLFHGSLRIGAMCYLFRKRRFWSRDGVLLGAL